MKWLRIIFVYISLLTMASCLGAEAPIKELNDNNVTVTYRNDTEWTQIVYIQNVSRQNTTVLCSEMKPGSQGVFAGIKYGDLYDIKWSSGWPKYKFIHWFSFRVNAGKVYFLTTPTRTISQYGDIHADWEEVDNTNHIK